MGCTECNQIVWASGKKIQGLLLVPELRLMKGLPQTNQWHRTHFEALTNASGLTVFVVFWVRQKSHGEHRSVVVHCFTASLGLFPLRHKSWPAWWCLSYQCREVHHWATCRQWMKPSFQKGSQFNWILWTLSVSFSTMPERSLNFDKWIRLKHDGPKKRTPRLKCSCLSMLNFRIVVLRASQNLLVINRKHRLNLFKIPKLLAILEKISPEDIWRYAIFEWNWDNKKLESRHEKQMVLSVPPFLHQLFGW